MAWEGRAIVERTTVHYYVAVGSLNKKKKNGCSQVIARKRAWFKSSVGGNERKKWPWMGELVTGAVMHC